MHGFACMYAWIAVAKVKRANAMLKASGPPGIAKKDSKGKDSGFTLKSLLTSGSKENLGEGEGVSWPAEDERTSAQRSQQKNDLFSINPNLFVMEDGGPRPRRYSSSGDDDGSVQGLPPVPEDDED
jgi:hypothetical protein